MDAKQKAAKLERELTHARDMERKAATRVKRASTLLIGWQNKRMSIERRIGAQEVQNIINRLTQTAGE
jgi:hypothetical protein